MVQETPKPLAWRFSPQSAVLEGSAILSVPRQAFQRSHSSKRLDLDTIAFISQPPLPFSFKASPDAEWMTFESTPLAAQLFSFKPEMWSLDRGVFSRKRWHAHTEVFHQTGCGKKKTKREADYNLLDKLIKTILIGFNFFKILLANLFKCCR